MATKKRKPRTKPSPIDPIDVPETPAQKDTPIRPGPQAGDQPPDESLIGEWEAEHSQAFEPLAGSNALLSDDDRLEESAGVEIRPDDFLPIKPEEIDEFDALMDVEPLRNGYGAYEPDPPQMRLLGLEEVDDFEQIFSDGQDLDGGPSQAAGSAGEPPVNIIEDEDMENEFPLPEHGMTTYQVAIDEPQPSFEDKGMGAGFYVTEEELQPSEAPLPEEAEYAPPKPAAETAPANGEFPVEFYFPPGPTIEIHKSPFVFPDLPPDSVLVEKQVTDDRVTRLMHRAENAQRRINDEIDSIELAREMLELLRNASALILSGRDKYEEAERSLNEVEYRLSYARRVKVWSDAIAYRLLAYEVFWLMTLGLGALFIPSMLSTMIGQLNVWAPNSLPDFIHMDDMFLGVSTALWGGLGGVVGAMFALWRHVSLKQDFNPQHKMWYYTQPIMGIPIGVVVFLLVRIGIGFTVEGVLNFSSPYAIYMVAWIAGFQQNVLYEIVRQMLKIFRFQS